jgi:hypothetical protein
VVTNFGKDGEGVEQVPPRCGAYGSWSASGVQASGSPEIRRAQAFGPPERQMISLPGSLAGPPSRSAGESICGIG